jgi:hypothetical protein
MVLKFLLSLLLLQQAFVFADPQDGHAQSMSLDKTSAGTVQNQAAPAGCKKLPTDADWPSPEVFNQELPGWEAPMPDGNKKHPNYVYEVKTVASAQRAVKFAAKYNLRLSIINSGHDFLGR